MSIFEDKEYAKMDWLTQAVEPIISSLNDKLIALPSEFVLTYNDVVRLAFSGYNDLRINEADLVAHCFRKNNLNTKDLPKEITEVYKLQLEGIPIVDMTGNGLSGGTIRIVKTKDHFEEKDLLKMMGREGFAKLHTMDTRNMDVARPNEILELLGGMENALKSKSVGSKCQAIAAEYDKIMQENRWNIRNVDLSNRIGEWIRLYLMHGNLAALTNFCKFKVMTHNNQAIYSIQEESV